MAYGDKVLDHYENPRNVGTLDKSDPDVGTGLVGAPACGDVMRLQVKNRPGAVAPSGEDPLLRPGGGCHQSGDRRLEEEARRAAGAGPRTDPGAEGGVGMAEAAIHLTPKAAEKILEQVAKRPQVGPQSGIRLGVKGGGCSGLSYVIEFCDQPRAKDRLFEEGGAKVYVDPKSLLYLNGTTLDFVDTFQQKGFKFLNPQQRSECGCGESFSV